MPTTRDRFTLSSGSGQGAGSYQASVCILMRAPASPPAASQAQSGSEPARGGISRGNGCAKIAQRPAG